MFTSTPNDRIIKATNLVKSLDVAQANEKFIDVIVSTLSVLDLKDPVDNKSIVIPSLNDETITLTREDLHTFLLFAIPEPVISPKKYTRKRTFSEGSDKDSRLFRNELTFSQFLNTLDLDKQRFRAIFLYFLKFSRTFLQFANKINVGRTTEREFEIILSLFKTSQQNILLDINPRTTKRIISLLDSFVNYCSKCQSNPCVCNAPSFALTDFILEVTRFRADFVGIEFVDYLNSNASFALRREQYLIFLNTITSVDLMPSPSAPEFVPYVTKFGSVLGELSNVIKNPALMLDPQIMEGPDEGVVPQAGLFDFSVTHNIPALEAFSAHVNAAPLTEFLTNSANLAKKTLDTADNLSSACATVLKFFQSDTFKGLTFVGSLVSLVLLCRDDFVQDQSNRLICTTLCSALVAYQMFTGSSHFIPTLSKILTILTNMDSEVIVPQVGLDTLMDLSGLLYTGMISYCFGVKNPKDMLNHLHTFWKTKPAIEEILTKSIEFLQEIVNSVLMNYTDYLPVRFLHSNRPIIDSLLAEIDLVISESNRKTLVPNNENYARISTLVSRCKKVYSTLNSDKNAASIARLFLIELQKLDKIKNILESKCVSLGGSRQEPVVIVLVGAPGVGKSLDATYLARDLSALDCSPEQLKVLNQRPQAFTFARAAENVFWDGYTHDNKVCIFDEFAQVRDCLGTSNTELMDFIRTGSMFDMPLKMADVVDKGTVNFTSKFVILTSNVKTFQPESICDPGALHRRFHFPYSVIPKPQFCTDATRDLPLHKRRMDPTKLPKRFISTDEKSGEISILSPYAHDFYRFNPKDGHEIGAPIDYDQLLSLITEAYNRRKMWYACQLSELEFRSGPELFYECEDSSDAKPQSGVEEDDPDEDLIDPIARMLYEDLFLSEKECKLEYFMNLTRHFSVLRPNLNESSVIWMIDTLVAQYGWDDARDRIKFNKGYLGPNPLFDLPEFKDFKKRLYVPPRKWTVKSLYAQAIQLVAKYGTKLLKSNFIGRFLIDFFYDDCYSQVRMLLIAYGLLIPFASLLSYAMGYLLSPKKKKKQVQPQSFNMGDKMGETKVKEKWVKKDIKNLLDSNPQIGHPTDPSGFQRVQSLIRKNQFIMSVESQTVAGTFVKFGTVTFVKGRLALMPYHFVTRLAHMAVSNPKCLSQEIRLVAIEAMNVMMKFSIHDLLLQFAAIEDSQINDGDIAIVEMPEVVQPRRDIVGCFAKRAQFASTKKNIDFLLVLNTENCVNFASGVAQAIDLPVPVNPDWSDRYYVRDGYSYNNLTSNGDCGSLFCVMNPSFPEKIFGIHVAGGGNNRLGYAQSICQEDINDFIDSNYVDPISIQEIGDIVPEMGTFEMTNHFNVIARLPSQMIPARISSTDIRPSVISGLVSAPTSAPAKLRSFEIDGRIVDPWKNAMAKYCPNPVLIPKFIITEAVNSYEVLLKSCSVQMDPIILTIDQALFGDPSMPEYRPVPRGTSAGFPFVIKGEYNIKKNIFRYEDFSSEQREELVILKEIIDSKITLLKQGIRPNWINIAHLKDERRPKAKVLSGSTRLFSGGPFDLMLITKMYFGSFVAFFMANRIQNGSGVGVNVYSSEWDSMARKLHSFGPGTNVGAGDYSAFDASQLPAVHWQICHMINRWYDDGPENCAIRKLLFLEIVNSKHIFGDLVVEWFSSLPSGHFLTIVVNTIYNHINYRMVWMLCDLPISRFNENVYLLAVGDDSTFTVSPEYAERFNEISISDHMPSLGMTYTTELKGIATIPLRELEEVEFLKRSFRRDPIECVYLGPLRLEVILEMINWTKRKDSINITCDNIDIALDELSLYPEPIFNDYARKIQKACDLKLTGLTFTKSPWLSYLQRKAFVLKNEAIVC
jgi:hypothetical protein